MILKEDFKACSKCGEEKLFSEFSKKKSGKYGLMARCRECISVINKKQYRENAEERKRKTKEYRNNNRDKVRECNRSYVKNNLEKVQGASRKYYEDHREERAAYGRSYNIKNAVKVKASRKMYYEENKESIHEKKREWNKNNSDVIREKKREYNRKNFKHMQIKKREWAEANREHSAIKAKEYRERNKEDIATKALAYQRSAKGKLVAANAKGRYKFNKLNTSDGTIPMHISYPLTEELQKLLDSQMQRCAYCEIALDFNKYRAVHLDHVVPLSKGGIHSISNVVWSCQKCNLTKNNSLDY